MENLWKHLLAAGGAAVSYAFGGWSGLLGVLAFLVALDYVSGVAAAWVEGSQGTGPGLRSSVGLIGIARKVFIFAIVAMAHLLDVALWEQHLLRDGAIFFYMVNEIISITENAGRVGVPMPPVIAQAVELLRNKSQAQVKQ